VSPWLMKKWLGLQYSVPDREGIENAAGKASAQAHVCTVVREPLDKAQ